MGVQLVMHTALASTTLIVLFSNILKEDGITGKQVLSRLCVLRQGKPMLLLFNKYDLFCRKLGANVSLTECDWLEDYDPGDHSTASDRFLVDVEAQNAYTYIENKFMALVEERNRRAPQMEVHIYKLTAVERDAVDMVLQHLPDIVPT
jgi:hypothetical protein